MDFTAKTIQTPEGTVVELGGVVNEDAQFDEIRLGDETSVIFDLDKVILINSVGIRGWILWMKQQPKNRRFTLRNCPPAIVDQLNIVEGFMPSSAIVESFYVPYFCESCQITERKLFVNGKDFHRGTADAAEKIIAARTMPCTKCGDMAEIDIMQTKYFQFLKYRR